MRMVEIGVGARRVSGVSVRVATAAAARGDIRRGQLRGGTDATAPCHGLDIGDPAGDALRAAAVAAGSIIAWLECMIDCVADGVDMTDDTDAMDDLDAEELSATQT